MSAGTTPDPARRIKGRLAAKVRRLHAAGASAEAIALALHLDLAGVGRFFGPRPPRRRPHRPPRPRRPRRPSYYTPREWGTSRGPEYRDGGPVPIMPQIAAEQPAAASPGIESNAGDDPPPAIAAAAAAAWGSMIDPVNRHRALGDAEAARLRALRAEGRSRRELAEAFGCSVATVGRCLARAGPYSAEPPAALVLDLVEASPATGPTATGHRWDPADDD